MPRRGSLCFQPEPVQLLRQPLSSPHWPRGLQGSGCLSLALTWSLLAPCRVPTVPVKNLTGSSPVNPALAGEDGAAVGHPTPAGAGLLGGTCSSGVVFGGTSWVWGDACSSMSFLTPSSRDHRDPDERSWAASLPDTSPQAGAASPTCQQKRDPVHPWYLPHLSQDHQETGQEG